MVEAGSEAWMKAGRSCEHDLLSVKDPEAFRGKKLHKYRVPVLPLRDISYKQMFYLVGIEILNSWFAVSNTKDEILVCLLGETFCIQIQVLTWPKKKNLMEIKLFKYRRVVSSKRPFQCCSRLKTKALLHKAKKKKIFLSANHFVRSQRVRFQVTVYWKDSQEMLKEGQSDFPLPILPKTVKPCCFLRWKI